MPVGLSNCLQSVLRAAARLVLCLPGHVLVMSAIRDMLHWLTYLQRVTFKLCLTTYKCLLGVHRIWIRIWPDIRQIWRIWQGSDPAGSNVVGSGWDPDLAGSEVGSGTYWPSFILK